MKYFRLPASENVCRKRPYSQAPEGELIEQLPAGQWPHCEYKWSHRTVPQHETTGLFQDPDGLKGRVDPGRCHTAHTT